VTRALGDFSFKYPIQALVAQPEVHSHQLDPERDLLVMSVTDGVTDFMSDYELGKLAWRSLQEVVELTSKPEEWAASVAEDVVAEVKRRGLCLGREVPVDNCSVAVAALCW
jgi:serine/threonine protein phosphatase PrpC